MDRENPEGWAEQGHGWGKAMSGKVREAIVAGTLIGLMAVGIVFF
jgi:hypothetical protein